MANAPRQPRAAKERRPHLRPEPAGVGPAKVEPMALRAWASERSPYANLHATVEQFAARELDLRRPDRRD